MSFKVRHANQIKDAVPYAKHANVIKAVKEIWVKRSGAIVKVWTAVSISVSGAFFPQGPSTGRRDTGTFSVFKSGGGAITSYLWSYSTLNGEPLMASSSTAPTYTLEGPLYDGGGTIFNNPVTISCTVTIDGQQYSGSLTTTYRSGSLS